MQHSEQHQVAAAAPLFSVVIAVYNDWAPLNECLQSLGLQANAPAFEVIIVDDGSRESAPEYIRGWSRSYPLAILWQSHAGVSVARNRGVQLSKGSVLLFVDADCRLEANCLSTLASTITRSPQHNCFQLHLVGDCTGVVGKAESLRLSEIQSAFLMPDGCIRYLNTAGFAIRKARANIEQGIFHPQLFRGEDTLLLVDLMEAGELPLFVPDARVQHVIPMSFLPCLRKDMQSAYLGIGANVQIASKRAKIRMTNRERLKVLLSTWKASGDPAIGRAAWFVLATRQALERTVSFALTGLRRCFSTCQASEFFAGLTKKEHGANV